jgi:two-component system sensor kinase FixL
LLHHFWARIDTEEALPPVGFGLATAVSTAFFAIAVTWLVRSRLGVELPFLFGIMAVIFNAVRRGMIAALCAAGISLVGTVIMTGTDNEVVNPRSVGIVALFCMVTAVSGEVLRQLRCRERQSALSSNRREHILQVMFRDSPAATLIADSLGYIVAANAAASRLFGKKHGSITGNSLPALIPEWGAGTSSLSWPLVPDGRLQHLSISETPLVVAGCSFRMIYIRDDTDALFAAEQLTTTQRELYQIARATALGQLGSSIAHELNQPLAFVANYAGAARALLASDTLNIEAIRGAVDDTLAQAFRAAGVLKRLRNFVGRKPPKLLTVNAREAMEDAARLGSLAVKDARAKLDTNFSTVDMPISVDVIQLQQIVLNLLINAADAVRGCNDRRIRLHGWSDASGELRFAVEDSGPGLPLLLRRDIFTPFKSTKTDGVGIGLAICRTIVEAHGGRIWCDDDTELGGARFVFTLPLLQPIGQSHAA